MGILNVTPDSFSGDGLLAATRPDAGAIRRPRRSSARERMVAEGADIIDIGGESTRPGHAPVAADEEVGRVVDGRRGGARAPCRTLPISIDTRKPRRRAARPLDAGADLLNDVGAVTSEAALARVAAARGVPYVLMHDRAQPASTGHRRARSSAISRRPSGSRVAAGCAASVAHRRSGHRLRQGRRAEPRAAARPRRACASSGLPVLLGTSRKSTIGRVLDLPPDERLEGTLATTALGIAAGVDIVRVHDVEPNVRAARMADAIVRGWHEADPRMTDRAAPAASRSAGCASRATTGSARRSASSRSSSRWTSRWRRTSIAAARTDDLADTIDYGPLIELTREVVEERQLPAPRGDRRRASLDAALAAAPGADAVTVRVRKLAVPVDADLDHAEVELRRERGA